MKEYQKHFIWELMEEICEHLSMIEHIDGERANMKENPTLFHAQCAYKHIKFLKEFSKDLEDLYNKES